MSTPSQEPTPTGDPVASPPGDAVRPTGSATEPAGAGAGPGDRPATSSDAPGGPVQKRSSARSPAQDRRVSVGLGIIVVGVVAAIVFALALKTEIPPLAASLITLIIGVVGGAVLGRPSRSGER